MNYLNNICSFNKDGSCIYYDAITSILVSVINKLKSKSHIDNIDKYCIAELTKILERE